MFSDEGRVGEPIRVAAVGDFMEAQDLTLSVVVPNWNHRRFLTKCLQSILSQSRPVDEIIVIDDASTDDSVALLNAFAERYPVIRVLRNETNQGVIAVLNRGLREARGSHVLFAAADDWTLPELAASSLALLRQHPRAGLCSALSYIGDEQGEILRLFPTRRAVRQAGYIDPATAARLAIEDDGWFMGNTVVLNRSLSIDAGGFRRELHSFCDGFLYLQLALRYGACFIPQPLGVWRRLDSGFSSAALSDPRRMLDIMSEATSLMTGPFADLFSAQHVRRWEARFRYWTAFGALLAQPRARSAFLAALPEARFWDKFAIGPLQRIPRLGKSLVAVYLFARLRRADLLPVLKRRLFWIFLAPHDHSLRRRSIVRQ